MRVLTEGARVVAETTVAVMVAIDSDGGRGEAVAKVDACRQQLEGMLS